MTNSAPLNRCLRLALAILRPATMTATALALCQCAGTAGKSPTDVVVSVKQQKLAIYDRKGDIAKEYPVSTSKFGLSDNRSRTLLSGSRSTFPSDRASISMRQ